MRERVGDAAVVLSVADELHREGGLSWPWSSLREALGLRAADWVDWRWLGAQRCPEQHLRKVAPGWCLPVLASPAWRSREPLPWALVEGAMLHGTGRDPRLRRDRLLRNRLAWAGGWSIPRIAERLGVQDRAVARGLLRAPPPDWGRTRVVLQDPRLRPSWLLGVNGRAKAAELEGPCPAMPTCWSVPEG